MEISRTINNTLVAMAIIVIVTMSLLPSNAFAQNNQYKINDKLYTIYKEADKKATTNEGIQLGKELYRKAVEIGDKKAQCLAFIIPVRYYENTKDLTKLKEAATNLKKISRKNNFLQYYYFAYTKEITYLQRNNKQIAALDELEKMKNEAINDKYSYGIALYFRMLGNIYWQRLDYANAKAVYKEGLEYFKANVKDQDQTPFNLMLARICNWQQNFKEGLGYLDDGLKNAKTEKSRTSLLIQKARLIFNMQEKEKFLAMMPDIDARVKAQHLENSSTYIHLKVCQYMIEDRLDEAKKMIEKLTVEDDRNMLLKQIAIVKQDWKTAYDYLSESYFDLVYKLSEIQTSDLAEMNSKFQNEKLHSDMLEQKMIADRLIHEREKAQREMQLMTLTNANMEMKQRAMSDSIDRATLIIDKTRLKMNSELAQKQVEVEKAQSENIKSKFKAQRILFIAGTLLMIAIVVNLAWNRIKSRRFIKKLSEKNEELIVARDKAQQSEKMKTMFIQNVSHEIRTPLNAIVGFSNLLVDPSLETSQEEKQEFRNLINNNSELLTSLVNDVLTLSELQSGKAGLNIGSCKINELCRIAIKTVNHRKPENVEIRFTTDVNDEFAINSDSRRINQVLINFLTNAEKYTTEGTITVDCSAMKKNGYITLSVTDTGCGIPKDKQQLIFERFEKLDDFHQGMGLGLNICAMIANLLNANIGIDDEYTGGARFFIQIPTK